MIIAVFGIVFLIVVYAPSVWVRMVLHRHSKDDPTIRGTGGELAKHLIERFELKDVTVEQTDPGHDHYDPSSNTVRLGPSNYNGRSLTAVAVATHEVGHAIQFNRQEPISKLRGQYLPRAAMIKRLGIAIIVLMPFITAIIHVPQVAILTAIMGVLVMLASASVYLIILPEEWDASFNKALPILMKGNYITVQQERAARSVLRAAALTYFAAALADVVRLWRWIAVLRGMR